MSLQRNISCVGPCAAGFYCPEGSTNATQLACGNATVYCPAESGASIPVSPGYYSDGNVNVTRRDRQTVCAAGQYCTDGEAKPCPATYFGRTPGLSLVVCSGLCPARYFCPQGTVDPLPCGGDTVFCAAGSSLPSSVFTGYYTTGGSGGNASYYRTAQR